MISAVAVLFLNVNCNKHIGTMTLSTRIIKSPCIKPFAARYLKTTIVAYDALHCLKAVAHAYCTSDGQFVLPSMMQLGTTVKRNVFKKP